MQYQARQSGEAGECRARVLEEGRERHGRGGLLERVIVAYIVDTLADNK
jgi:hypothetical protein